MKVKYIGDYYKASLLKGKYYEAIEDEEMTDYYKITDETGEWFYFPKQLFEDVDK